jgi:hypothetical protein
MAVWGDVSMVYMRHSPRGSYSGALWTMVVLWRRRSLGHRSAALFWHSACHTVSTWIGLPQVDLLESCWWWRRSALGADVWAWELPSPWRPRRLVFLCHTPCMTLSRERPARPHPKCSVWEPLSLNDLGLVFLCPVLGWHRRPGKSQGSSMGVLSVENLRLGWALEPWAGDAICLGSIKFLRRRVRASIPEGYSPWAPGRSWRGWLGVSLVGNHCSRGLTYPYVRISSPAVPPNSSLTLYLTISIYKMRS